MNTNLPKITIVGAGTMGTAMGQVLAENANLTVVLLSVEDAVVYDISMNNCNSAYFPQQKLHTNLFATADPAVLQESEFVFLALPSVVVVDYMVGLRDFVHPDSVLVNLSKGFGRDGRTIVENLMECFENPISSLKGPAFARELINHLPTAMTVGCDNGQISDKLVKLISSSVITTDTSPDVIGVELLSILKNIYAIVIGIVDAQFNSANLRFLVFTKAFNEMRHILKIFGGNEETMFKYCGIGDFGLTALNDLSRNRTLGLLIGKGFFNNEISDKVVLEGKIAVGVFVDVFHEKEVPSEEYFMMNELYKVFHEPYKISSFVSKILAP